MDRGTWRATVHGVAKSRTQLNNRVLRAELGPVSGAQNSVGDLSHLGVGLRYPRGP